MKKIHVEAGDSRIIVAFGDITGFSRWVRKASRDDFRRLMSFLLRSAEGLNLRNGFMVKDTGDGYMATAVMAQSGHNCGLASTMIEEVRRVNRDVLKEIKRLGFPRPGGFRSRILAGDAIKLTKSTDVGHVHEDFVGESVNTAERLLDVRREVPIIVHESVVDLLTKAQRRRFHLTKLDVNERDRPPRDVDQEDMQALWQVKL